MKLETFTVKRILSFVAVVAVATTLFGSSAQADSPAPRITEVLPHTVERGKTHTFVVTGSGFQPDATFRLQTQGNTPTTINPTSTEVVSEAEIRAVVAIPDSASLYDAVVRNPDGREAKADFAVGVPGNQRIIPTLDCVEFDRSRSQVTAYFGYVNHYEERAEVTVGAQNFFHPLPARRTQPIDYDPGVFKRVFSVTFDVTTTPHLTWRLFGRGVRAKNDPALYCEQSADVRVSQSAEPEPATVGDELTYTVTATNDGPLPATGVTLTDDLPDGVELVSATSSRDECSGTETVVCPIGSLAWGESESVEIVVKPERAGTLANTASVRADQRDRNAANNVSTLRTTVAARSAPEVESVDPNQGTRSETLPVTIDGSGFADGARAALVRGSIRLGVEDIKVNEAGSELSGELEIPEGFPLGDYGVEVRNPDGQEGVLEDGFSVLALPMPNITGISPSESLRGREANVSIEGSDFRDGARVTLAGEVRLRAQSVSLEPSGNLTAKFSIPANMPTGSYDLELRNPDGQESVLEGAFSVFSGTDLGLDTDQRTLDFGQRAGLSGRLTSDSGNPLSGREVLLESRPASGGQFRRVGTLTTNNDGAFSARVSPRENTVYRARFTGDEENRSSQRAVRVNVRAVVNLNLSRESVPVGQNVVIAGNVRPAKTSFVNLTIRRGGEVVVNRRVNLNEQSRYQFVYRAPARGNYLVQVRYPGDQQNIAGGASQRFGAFQQSQQINQTIRGR